MPMEKKVLTLEEIQFRNKWGKISKRWADVSNYTNKVGKAPKCNIKVKTASVEVASSKKKR